MTINLGNFPPMSKLILTAQCSQKLEISDLSYSLTVPMAYVPKYMGDVDRFIRTGVTLFDDAPDAETLLQKQSNMKAALDSVRDLAEMPLASKSSAVWDLNVNIRSNSPLSRLSSVNHPIAVQFAHGSTVANVRLDQSVDRRLVPCMDFVLLFRDKSIDNCNPTALASVGKSGHQAVSLSLLPDFRPTKVRLGAKAPILPGVEVDFSADQKYDVKVEDQEESKEPVFVEPKQNEYIFLIDRSGSMYNTIKMANRAL